MSNEKTTTAIRRYLTNQVDNAKVGRDALVRVLTDGGLTRGLLDISAGDFRVAAKADIATQALSSFEYGDDHATIANSIVDLLTRRLRGASSQRGQSTSFTSNMFESQYPGAAAELLDKVERLIEMGA